MAKRRTQSAAGTDTGATTAPAPRRSTRKAADHTPQSPAEVQLAEANAAIKSDLDAREKVDGERSTLEKRLEKLEGESAENERKYQESASEVAELRARLDKGGATAPPVPMKAQAFDEAKSRKQFRDIRPLADPRRGRFLAAPAPKAKTYKVIPISGIPGDPVPAVVSNCADQGDAKQEYFRRTGATPHKAHVKVQEFGDTLRETEERQRAADELAAAPLDDVAAFAEWKRTTMQPATVRATARVAGHRETLGGGPVPTVAGTETRSTRGTRSTTGRTRAARTARPRTTKR